MDGTLRTTHGRTVGFADYGTVGQTALLWCHGGPGNRHEPSIVGDSAARAGIRLIGIDRPGYGQSTPQPGRTIGGWVPDALAVLDHLGVDQFLVLGVSTGGAYALATAASSSRVIGAVACCAVSDARYADVRALTVCCHTMWNARDRSEAFDIATGQFGEHGEGVLPPIGPPGADPSDSAFFATPAALSWWTNIVPEMFAQGVVGFVDDRLADANGWGSFDVTRISCPVTVMHGTSDGLVPVATAHHTASLIPGATLRLFADLGHISVVTKTVEVTSELLVRCAVAR